MLEFAPPSAVRRRLFREGMQEHGWTEGHDVEYLFMSAEGQDHRLPALAAGLLAAGAEVIATSSAVSTRALQQATGRVPIVMVNVVDPVANGFAASLARPGSNITGLTNQQQDLFGKWVQFMREIVPALQRLAFLINGGSPASEAFRSAAAEACAAFGVTPLMLDARSPESLAAAFAQIRSRAAQGIVVPADPFLHARSESLMEMVRTTRLPAIFGQRVFAERGGLLSYGVNFDAQWRQAARHVDRILRGASPAQLPIEQPTHFELVVNQRAARELGLVLPKALLVRADEVIE